MRSRLEENAIKMHSTHNEKKSVVAKICTRTLKNKKLIGTWLQYEKMCILIDKLEDTFNKYNNT